MKAIILAAGSGIKMRERNEVVPTCLMRIGKETLLQRQIKILKKQGVEDIAVIVGKTGNCWSQKNTDKIKKIADNVIVNPLNASTPSTSSLALGLNCFEPSECLIIDGDLVFEESVIKAIIKEKNKNAMLIERIKTNRRGSYVEIKDGYVTSIGPDVKTNTRGGGLVKISKKFYKELKGSLQARERLYQDYNEIVNKKLSRYKFKVIDPEKIEGEIGDLFDLEPLKGGSFADTKVISKIVKKKINIVRKEAIEGKEKLVDEINWIKNLPSDLSSYFPEIVDYKVSKDKAWYEMHYHNLPTLRYLIINKLISKEEALYILKMLVKLMFSKFYTRSISKSKGDYAKKVHLNRIKERLVTTAQKSELMKRIINSKSIIINGKKYHNIPRIIDMLEKDENLMKSLEPPFLCMVHGDLHFDDILVDISQMPMVRFVFLDPRGLDNTYSYCYDLGKLWHSANGKYDLLHEGLFELDYEFKEGTFIAKTEFTDKELFLFYSFLHKEIRKFLSEFSCLQKDKNWETRADFSDMANFCSVMPFHLKNDEKETLAVSLYLRGVKLANEFISKYSKVHDKFLVEKSYFNVNTLEEYELARKRFEKNNRMSNKK